MDAHPKRLFGHIAVGTQDLQTSRFFSKQVSIKLITSFVLSISANAAPMVRPIIVDVINGQECWVGLATAGTPTSIKGKHSQLGLPTPLLLTQSSLRSRPHPLSLGFVSAHLTPRQPHHSRPRSAVDAETRISISFPIFSFCSVSVHANIVPQLTPRHKVLAVGMVQT